MKVVTLARKPLGGSTKDTALRWGTGALNIDTCRIGTTDSLNGGAYSGDSRTREDPTHGTFMGALNKGLGEFIQPDGRWPPNVILEHLPLCQCSGTRTVSGHKGYPNGPGGKSMHYSCDKRGAEVRPEAWAGYADAEGNETVDDWICAPGCPVAALNEQSGITTSGAMRKEVPPYSGESSTSLPRGRSGPSNQHGGSGGASRFFKQIGGNGQ